MFIFGHLIVNLINFNMASLNKVILIGRLGKDPEITSFENGNKKMSVSLATSERYRDRDGNWVEQTDWHNLVNWGTLAHDIAEKRRNYVKGDLMYVEGRIKTRQYVDNQNITRNVTEIMVDKMMNIGTSRSQNVQNQQNTSYNNYFALQQQQSQNQGQQQTPNLQQSQNQSPADIPVPDPDYSGDDLPF